MDIYKVTFFGHRDFCIDRKVEERLYSLVGELIRTKEYVEFYIGRNGDFDIFAASVIKRAQNAFGHENSALILVLPYKNKDVEYYEKYYDSVIIPECVEKVHPKGAIAKRNKWMAEESDLVICFVERESGGAYAALKYALESGRKMVNLAADSFVRQEFLT